jgi:hypothetical protein
VRSKYFYCLESSFGLEVCNTTHSIHYTDGETLGVFKSVV